MIVFVSYSSRNRERIEELVLQLGQLGHDVQFESKVIGGEITWQQVMDSIVMSDVFIATLSAETLVSYSNHIEYDYARDLNKFILLVALDEVSTLTALEPQVRANAIDFSSSNPTANDALGVAIASLANLEPRSSTEVLSPNWNASLDELRQRVEAENGDPTEQAIILLNICEFLERRETFEKAKSLLATFSTRGDLRPEIRAKTRRITSQVKQVGSLIQKIQRRSIFLIAIILSLLISLAVVVLSQVVSQIRAQRSVTLLTSTSLTPRPVTTTFTPVHTRVLAANTVMPSETAVQSALISPFPSNTAISTSDSIRTSAATVTPIALSPSLTPTVIQLATNTPRPVSPTSVAQVILSATKLPVTSAPHPVTLEPTVTFTLPASSMSTPVQTTQVAVSIEATLVPTQTVSLVPSGASLAQLTIRNVYIGIGVEESVFGVRVNVVGTTANSAGVKVGDYILAVDSDIVRTSFEFFKAMQAQNPHSSVTLRLRRNNQIVVVPLVLGERDFALPYPS